MCHRYRGVNGRHTTLPPSGDLSPLRQGALEHAGESQALISPSPSLAASRNFFFRFNIHLFVAGRFCGRPLPADFDFSTECYLLPKSKKYVGPRMVHIVRNSYKTM